MLPITPETARLLLMAMDLGQAAAKQVRLANLDELTPEMREEINQKAAVADAGWDRVVPKSED